jgi:3-mercaptopyruvate sulfurtransferase SseA
LDGGLPEWAKQGYSVEKEKRDYALGNFEIQTRTVQTKEQNFRKYEQQKKRY